MNLHDKFMTGIFIGSLRPAKEKRIQLREALFIG